MSRPQPVVGDVDALRSYFVINVESEHRRKVLSLPTGRHAFAASLEAFWAMCRLNILLVVLVSIPVYSPRYQRHGSIRVQHSDYQIVMGHSARSSSLSSFVLPSKAETLATI